MIFDIQTVEKFAKNGLNCKQMAKKFGVHYHRFGMLFKKQTGIYPSVYIKRVLDASRKA
jgi:YesN/AraC family two-component response regulator